MKLKPIYLILILGLILRLISLGQSLWLDEAINWWASSSFSLPHLVNQYISGDFNPPLFHIILHFWIKLFGSSEIALRLPSVFFGILTVFFTYKMANFIIPKQKHLAALFTATAPLLIYYSQEARMYSLAAFTATAAIYYALRLKKKSSLLLTVYYLLFVVMMLYSHYLTWLLLPVLLLLLPRLTSFSLLALVPWLPILYKQLLTGISTSQTNPVWGNVVGSLSLKSVVLVPVKFLIGRISIDNNFIFASVLILPLTLYAYLLYQAKNRHKLLWAWLLLPLLLGALIAFFIPVFSYFRFLFVLPPFYLLLASGISRLKKHLRDFAFILIIIINISSSLIYLFSPGFHRENWQGAATYIHSFNTTDPVLIYSAVSPPFTYYNQDASVVLTEKTLDEAVSYPNLWYIPYAQPIFDPEDRLFQSLQAMGFQETLKRHFRGVTVIRFRNLNYRYFSFLNLKS